MSMKAHSFQLRLLWLSRPRPVWLWPVRSPVRPCRGAVQGRHDVGLRDYAKRCVVRLGTAVDVNALAHQPRYRDRKPCAACTPAGFLRDFRCGQWKSASTLKPVGGGFFAFHQASSSQKSGALR
ncbi:hypothetical protein [Laceyella putida]|uniref:Secreted protein n=1 Tax=Laceyella putida TaxID=110101 RepID=A0ABW2RFD9_9BACL